MEEIKIELARFSTAPGPRLISQGDDSAQSFRDDTVIPNFVIAQRQGKKIILDLDGTSGVGPSFLEELFGELSYRYGPDEVRRMIRVKFDDEPTRMAEIEKDINEGPERHTVHRAKQT